VQPEEALMRLSWIKMVYGPDDAEALGELRQSVKDPSLWRFVHQTRSSQRHAGYSSPGGVDIGLVTYLKSLAFKGTYVLRYSDTGKVFEIPFETLLLHTRSGIVAHTKTRRGKRRYRVFVSEADWTNPKWDPAEFLAGGRIAHGDTIHIDTNGDVIAKEKVTSVLA
jgi:hypothetical protein